MARKLLKQIANYMDYCENARYMSEETIKGKQFVFEDFARTVSVRSLEQLSNKDINDWVAAQKNRGCSARTVNTRIAHLKVMLTWQRDMNVIMPKLNLGMITKFPEDPPKRVYYSREEINIALRYADRREWLMIRLCFECGLRIGELQKLRLSNINGRKITFTGKCRIRGTVVMSEETRVRLDDWIINERVTNYLWRKDVRDSETEQPLTIEQIRRSMRKPFLKAGFNDFHPHALRHSFATEICNNGASMEQAEHMLRHKSITNTERYVHSFDNHAMQNFTTFMHSKKDYALR